jgi:hypothetical protein
MLGPFAAHTHAFDSWWLALPSPSVIRSPYHVLPLLYAFLWWRWMSDCARASAERIQRRIRGEGGYRPILSTALRRATSYPRVSIHPPAQVSACGARVHSDRDHCSSIVSERSIRWWVGVRFGWRTHGCSCHANEPPRSIGPAVRTCASSWLNLHSAQSIVTRPPVALVALDYFLQ